MEKLLFGEKTIAISDAIPPKMKMHSLKVDFKNSIKHNKFSPNHYRIHNDVLQFFYNTPHSKTK